MIDVIGNSKAMIKELNKLYSFKAVIEKYERRIDEIESLWPQGPEYCPSGILEDHDRMVNILDHLRHELAF